MVGGLGEAAEEAYLARHLIVVRSLLYVGQVESDLARVAQAEVHVVWLRCFARPELL